MSELSAILLAGGRGSRMGGIHKPSLEVGGRSLLTVAVTAARDAVCDPIIVVGDAVTDAALISVVWVREEPPFGGPAAAIMAALPFVTGARTLVLACDLPGGEDAAQLLCAAPFGGDGICLEDQSGSSQWLAGIYRTEALRSSAARLPHAGSGASVSALLGGLDIHVLKASDELTADIDTWDDLDNARRRIP